LYYSSCSRSLPANLFIWDKNPQVRVHRIPREFDAYVDDYKQEEEKREQEDIFVMLRPSLVALLGKKNFYKSHGKDIDGPHIHRLNVNEVYKPQSIINDVYSKFKKCVTLDKATLRYISMFPKGSDFVTWFVHHVKKN
jgi:hypothetical protein